MNFSALFIRRPVATTLLTLAVALAGVLAFLHLPVASLPEVDFPTLSVSAEIPGASAETMAKTVATPLERALGRIAGITEMTSESGMGSTQITLQFDLSRDINGAARDVQAAINAAGNLLPSNMPSLPSYRRDNPADSPIIVLTLTSDTLNLGQIYDVAATLLAQKIAQTPGVGSVDIRGASMPGVRVELNPHALNQYGIGLEDVRATITQSNTTRPKGEIEQAGRRWQVQANDQARKAADYAPMIVSYRNGAPVTIADLGRVEDAVENLSNTGVKDGKPAVLLVVKKQPQANVIEAVDRIKAMVPQLRASIPGTIDLQVASDRSLTIRASLTEVEHTMGFAILLVILVVLAFLRDWRSTLIPIIAVPVSLLGACAVMYLCDYSLNNLSLMALTIATGFVVDDAIVVLENASRHIEKGMAPFKAALLAAKEVGFTVLAMNVALIAVFLPILLMGGLVGRLFREFAVTLSAAVLVSLLVSLTVTPMLCARWLGKESPRHGRLYRGIERGFVGLQRFYERSLSWTLRHRRLMLAVFAATLGLNVYLYKIIDKGFFPTQDGGRLMGVVQADQGVSFWAMQDKFFEFAKRVRQDPAVTNINGFFSSQRSLNNAIVFIDLKDHDQRDSIDSIMRRFRTQFNRIPGATLQVFPAQELRIGGRSSPSLFQFSLQSDDLDLLRAWTPKVESALSELPELNDVSSNQQEKGEQIGLVVDRELAARYGVDPALIDASLNDAFGQRQVSVIYEPLNQYRVVMELAPEYWQSPEALKHLYVSVPEPASAGRPRQVPVASFAHFAPGNTPLTVSHQGQFAATTLSFNLQAGVSLSAATQAVNQAMRKIGVPDAIQGSFQGAAKAFQQSLDNQPLLILAALVSIYLVLGVLYENLLHPLTILSTLPSAGVGALLTLMACGTEFSIIALVGVILLIGIVMKNAIMMIDFALQAEREHALDSRAAIFEACMLRFRPILMTSMAALFGALPLALGSGYGAELRQPLGITIIGGLMFSQLLTLYTTPVVYLYLDSLRFGVLARFFNRSAGPAAHSA